MTRLNAAAKAVLQARGISHAEWARRNFTDGRWHGDACGCTDDRCIGYHHDDPDDCGCLPVLLARAERDRTYARAVATAPVRGVDLDRLP